MMAETYWAPLALALSHKANGHRAQQMAKYMRGQFAFYGIDATTVKELTAHFNRSTPLPSSLSLQDCINWCWEQPQREWQYIGQRQLYRFRQQLQLNDHPWLATLTLQCAWWDTVDFLAGTIWGYYFKQFPSQREQLIPAWIEGDEMWLQRVAILFQLKYKTATNTDWLLYAIEACKSDNDFFIRKAIGWALRQYARIDPYWVKRYVDTAGLSNLSRREALKHINKG